MKTDREFEYGVCGRVKKETWKRKRRQKKYSFLNKNALVRPGDNAAITILSTNIFLYF